MPDLKKSGNRSRMMAKLKESPTTFACRLWPKHVARIRDLEDYLTDIGDGSKACFADCVRWMLDHAAIVGVIEEHKEQSRVIKS
jgi:hypothetical protein